MTEEQLYRRCDDVLGPYLEPRGFYRDEPADYSRAVQGGEERIQVSKGPPSKGRTHFVVGIGYEPECMRVADELANVPRNQRGFLAPFYLNPVGASFRPKYWSYENSEVLEKSLQHVIFCLERAGFAWMESLRDPKLFAANADPMAAVPYGLANEVAGNLDRARAGYEDMLARLRQILKMKLPEREILTKYAKPFIFVAAKLGVEQDQAAEFKRKLNWFPEIVPLAHGGHTR